MLYRQLCLAATAAAFLVVPEVTEADKDVISTLPAPVDAAHPVLMPSDLHLDIPYHQEGGADAAISLNFLVEGGSRLTLNGFELYPSADPWHGDLTAEVEAHDGAREEKTLGYGLFVKPEVSDAEQQLSLVAIDLQLLEVGGVFDKGLPKVEIKLIKGPTGDIVIGSVDAVVETVEEKANNPLLRIKEKVEEFWKKLSSGCGRHRKGSAKHGHFETYEGGRPFRHDSLHGHHRHGGHRHRHDWGRLLKNIAANIVLPVLAGITAGVGVAVYVYTPSLLNPLAHC